MTMTTTAFVTYNTLANGVASGWHRAKGRRALVVQNTKGRPWAVKVFEEKPDDYRRSDPRYVGLVRDEIGILWRKLQRALPKLDHIVIYVGASGSELAIQHAAKLPVSKVTFVGCDCALDRKTKAIQATGLQGARLIDCECGGRRTMAALYDRFMATGTL